LFNESSRLTVPESAGKLGRDQWAGCCAVRSQSVTRSIAISIVVFGVIVSGVLGPGVGSVLAAEHVESEPESGFELEVEPTVVTLDDVGEGRCFPAVTVSGRVVECRFPIVGDAALFDQFDFAVYANQPVPFDDDDPPRCEIVDGEVVCSAIQAYYRPGISEVALGYGGSNERALASFEVVEVSEYGVDAHVSGGTEPVAMADRPVSLAAYPTTYLADVTAWVLVSPRGSDEVIDVVAVETSADGVWPDTVIVAPEEPGRYTLSLCVGVDSENCDLVPGNFGVQVIDPRLKELVAGHNRPGAERINLVFAGSSFDSSAEMAELALDLLTLDGPVAIDEYGESLGSDLDSLDPDDVIDLVYGPFAIEPLRSFVDRFNFWYLEDDLVDDRALFHNSDPEFSIGDELAGFGLPHTAVVTLDLQGLGEYGRSEASWTSFKLREDVPALDEIAFAGVYLAIDSNWRFGAATTLAHEFGHSLFDLRDEYVEFGRTTQYGYPNCASDVSEAEAWWGDLVGEVDPFVYEYLDDRSRFDLYTRDDLVDAVTVGNYVGGCYGNVDVIRPTSDSIMNSEVPIFGPTSRRRVEDLLGQFSGRSVLSSQDDLSITCLPGVVSPPGRSVRCRGSLAPGVDAPLKGLRVGVAGSVVECTVAEIDDSGARKIECEGIELVGAGPWTVTSAIDAGRAVVVTRITNSEAVDPVRRGEPADLVPVPAVVSVAPELEPQTGVVLAGELAVDVTPVESDSEFTVTGDGETSVGWSLAAGAFALVFIGIGGYLWSRKIQSDKDADAGS